MATGNCFVIRGICDYADSHKNDQWHNYAAGTGVYQVLPFSRGKLGVDEPRSRSFAEADCIVVGFGREFDKEAAV
ncbi:hypothetical protein BJY01DRAFT_220720 [Aspergillus pseudoustus]|uniref:Uncharacterized protein n=1 Tax=Aspergillus pseudoustus TaxID=1810923 RepID=A0ABR4JC46_9EURO